MQSERDDCRHRESSSVSMPPSSLSVQYVNALVCLQCHSSTAVFSKKEKITSLHTTKTGQLKIAHSTADAQIKQNTGDQ